MRIKYIAAIQWPLPGHWMALQCNLYASSLVKDTSRVMRTLSETRNPPASSAAFQVRPNASREMSVWASKPARVVPRSEEHTSELQSRFDLVCRLLLETKK